MDWRWLGVEGERVEAEVQYDCRPPLIDAIDVPSLTRRKKKDAFLLIGPPIFPLKKLGMINGGFRLQLRLTHNELKRGSLPQSTNPWPWNWPAPGLVKISMRP